MSASIPAMPSRGTEAFMGKYKRKFKWAYVCGEERMSVIFDISKTKPSSRYKNFTEYK
jgi:hypothetical protein